MASQLKQKDRKEVTAFLLKIGWSVGNFNCHQREIIIDVRQETPVSKLTRHKIMSGGIERKYRIYIPESYDGQSPVPRVLNFHGSGGNPRGQFGYSDLQTLSERKSFIAVMPTGIYKNRNWNAGLDPDGVDDV